MNKQEFLLKWGPLTAGSITYVELGQMYDEAFSAGYDEACKDHEDELENLMLDHKDAMERMEMDDE